MEHYDSPKPAIKESWRELCIVGFIAISLLFPMLGKRDIWTAGEARVAQVAVQMVQSGDWVVPHLGDDLRLAKPPLAYWLVCLTSPFDASGITEFKSRIPNVIAAIIVAIVLCLWGREIIGGYGGLLAGVAFVTTSACWWQARSSTIEMTLLCSTVLTLYCWWRYNISEKSLWLYLVYFFAGLAVLDKGPVTPPLILIIIVVYLISSGSFSLLRIKLKSHLVGVGIFLTITLPWAVAITLIAGKNKDGDYLTIHEWFYQSAGRFKGFDHIKNIWYFLPKILGDGQPWVFFALIGIIAFFLYRKTTENLPGIRFFVTWVVVTFIFFSIPSSKKSYYILPIYPAFAILSAWLLNSLISGFFKNSKIEKANSALCEFFGTSLVLMGLTLPFADDFLFDKFPKIAKYSDYTSELMFVSAFAVIVGVLLAYTGTKKTWRLLPIICFFSTVISFAGYSSMIDRLNAHKGDKVFCQEIKENISSSDKIYTLAMGGQPIYRYYLNRHVERILDMNGLVRAMKELPDGGRMVLGIDEREWLKFNDIYLVTYNPADVQLPKLELIINGLQVRYPKDIDVLVKTSLRPDKACLLVKLGARLPKKHAGVEQWEQWKNKNRGMIPEIYETKKRLLAAGARIERLGVIFSEFCSSLDSGRLWIEYDKNIKEEKKLDDKEKQIYERRRNKELDKILKNKTEIL